MKKYFVVFAVAFTVTCFALAAYFAQVAGSEGMTSLWTSVVKADTNPAEQRSVAIALDTKEISELQISLTDEDLKIEESPDGQLHILFSMRTDSTVPDESEILRQVAEGVYSLNLDEIAIADKDVKVQFVNVFNFNVTVKDAEVIVQIPKSVKRIKAKAVSGDIKISLDAGELAAEAVSGDLRIHGDIARLEAKTISGDIKVRLQDAAPQAKLNTISGDVRFVVGSAPDFILDFETTSGEIGFDQRMSKTHFESSFKGFQLGQGRGKVAIKTISGDARISRERRE